MYIHGRPGLKTCYRLIITILAIFGIGLELLAMKENAWRLFATWSLFLTAAYFLISAVKTAFYLEDGESAIFCPMWQGLVLISNLILLVAQFFASVQQVTVPGLAHGEAFLICGILPVLVLLDWMLMSPKGKWRPSYPFDWLTFPIVYVAGIYITAKMRLADGGLIYPYSFLNPELSSLGQVIWLLIIIATLILVMGYILFVLDFIMSGRLQRYIVLPRIKTIVIEEQIDTPEPVETAPQDMSKEKAKKGSKPQVSKPVEKVQVKTKPSVKTRPAGQKRPQSKTTRKVKVVEPSANVTIENHHDHKSAQNIHRSQRTTKSTTRSTNKSRLSSAKTSAQSDKSATQKTD